eukprot:5258736-Heterocapsa_arctica.AAC.1
MKTKPTNHHQGPQPMDLGQFDENNTDLNAIGGKGGKSGKGPTAWRQPAWGQLQKGDKGKSKGKGKG